jgi:uncharacterized protein YozE (UPF0346 family)
MLDFLFDFTYNPAMKLPLYKLMKSARSEADVKNFFQDYFQMPDVHIGWVDMSAPHIFFETKQRDADIFQMLAQLILTIHKHQKDFEFLPEYIGGFDSYKCGIVEFDSLYQRLITYSDINWNQAPSMVDDKTVRLVAQFVRELPNESSLRIYEYDRDEAELASVLKKIQSGRAPNGAALQKQINFGNYVSVFMKFAQELSNNIEIPAESEKEDGILPLDFYLADLMSDGDRSLEDLGKLKVLRDGPVYKSNLKLGKRLFIQVFKIKDLEKHSRFWARYKRPPKREYWDKIITRRDLLVPRNVRQCKGAFFTPKIWVAKATEYMASAFGDEFADMYVWDCAAGTGNLLQYLPQDKRNVFASTLDEPDVQIMKQTQITMENNIFQFDFLNDIFNPQRDGGKVPDRLYDILSNENDRKNLVIFINPPYAEAQSGQGRMSKSGIAQTYIAQRYKSQIGAAANELFTQFLIRAYMEIPNCRLAEFSKLKTLQAGNFGDFRNVFAAALLKCFIVPANTFENVNGKFPIGFKIWNTELKEKFVSITADVFDKDGEPAGFKKFYGNLPDKKINQWIAGFQTGDKRNSIGFLDCASPDFQNQKYVFIDNPENEANDHRLHLHIDGDNLLHCAMYFAVRHCMEPTWLNDRDQFLFPLMRPKYKYNPVIGVPAEYRRNIVQQPNLLESEQEFSYENDFVFKYDCLIYTLFHSQNRVSSKSGTNRWIPFSESQVGSARAFDSDFMSNFAAVRRMPEILSPAARDAYNAGLAVWRYYFSRNPENQNASFYDIKEFFKGRQPAGRMNIKSDDGEFNELESALSAALSALAAEIEPKVYEYGFLRK